MNQIISVIIPVFNREKQIKRCIDSLLAQTYQNLEIIIINDGSTDHTAAVLAAYQDQYKDKIVIINTVNQGVSMARNEGIQIARGDYICFLDSDDYVDAKLYEKLYNKMMTDDFDVVACNTLALYPNRTLEINSGISDYQSTKKLLIDAYSVLWNKLYKADLVKKLRFKKDVWYEDVLFLYQLYPQLKKVGSIDYIGCYYVQNEGSITYTYNDKLFQLIENMDDIITYYHEQGIYDEYKEELEYSYVRYLYGTFIKRLAKSKDYRKYRNGVKVAIKKVKENFPYYTNNKYINLKAGKSLYLKYFNGFVATLIYMKEKNKMN